MQAPLTERDVKELILKEVGKGRMNSEEAVERLRTFGVTPTEGFRHSCLAFEASAILEGAGFTRNGFEPSNA